ncbi:MAG: RNase H1/viroplasmin domain-containing protein [Sphingobacteriales bacterium]|nr:RNase H1/viroplasmin domain-containing protein [Sphingobacteriales bacterium]
MSSKKKYYVVWTGRKTGIFRTWDECKAQVDGFAQARYQSLKV